MYDNTLIVLSGNRIPGSRARDKGNARNEKSDRGKGTRRVSNVTNVVDHSRETANRKTQEEENGSDGEYQDIWGVQTVGFSFRAE